MAPWERRALDREVPLRLGTGYRTSLSPRVSNTSDTRAPKIVETGPRRATADSACEATCCPSEFKQSLGSHNRAAIHHPPGESWRDSPLQEKPFSSSASCHRIRLDNEKHAPSDWTLESQWTRLESESSFLLSTASPLRIVVALVRHLG